MKIGVMVTAVLFVPGYSGGRPLDKTGTSRSKSEGMTRKTLGNQGIREMGSNQAEREGNSPLAFPISRPISGLRRNA